MKENYVDTDMVQLSKERINNLFGQKPFNSIIANGYDRVYGNITTNVNIDIRMETIKDLYCEDITKIFSKSLISVLFGMWDIDDMYFKAIFWDNSRKHIVGFIVE